MNYFNHNVMEILSSKGIKLKPEELSSYVALCMVAQGQNKEQMSEANIENKRNYSIWHGFENSNDPAIQHWMILPNEGQAPLMLNLVTAKISMLKSRPKPEPGLSQAVIDVLLENKINLTQDQMNAYEKIRRQAVNEKYPFKQRKKDLNLPYSVWHVHRSARDKTMNSYLVFPAPKDWKPKSPFNGQETVAKVLINLETGENRVVKVRRVEKRFLGCKNQEIEASIQEASNNRKLGFDALHHTRYIDIVTPGGSTATSKAYLFMPFYGKQNLWSYIKHTPNLAAAKIVRLLMLSGRCLQNLHNQGYLHLDFKASNLVFDEDKDMVTLIDYDMPLTQEQGKEGIRLLRYTKDHVHPEWFDRSEKNDRAGKKVFYTLKNDVYAFLHTADLMLSEASKAAVQQKNQSLKKKIDQSLIMIKEWKEGPDMTLPSLSEVMQSLQGLLLLILNQDEGLTHKSQNRYHM